MTDAVDAGRACAPRPAAKARSKPGRPDTTRTGLS